MWGICCDKSRWGNIHTIIPQTIIVVNNSYLVQFHPMNVWLCILYSWVHVSMTLLQDYLIHFWSYKTIQPNSVALNTHIMNRPLWTFFCSEESKCECNPLHCLWDSCSIQCLMHLLRREFANLIPPALTAWENQNVSLENGLNHVTFIMRILI